MKPVIQLHRSSLLPGRCNQYEESTKKPNHKNQINLAAKADSKSEIKKRLSAAMSKTTCVPDSGLPMANSCIKHPHPSHFHIFPIFTLIMITLKEGDKAPAFSGKNQKGEKIALSDFKGKKLVLYFYPQDDTPTCTIQACNLRDNFSLLKQKGFEIVGVSPDDERSHQKFEAKYSLPFNLLADPDHKIIDKYGVWGEKQLYGRKYMGLHRTTFVIDEKGVIRKIFLRPKNKQHAEEIIQCWQQQ